MIDLQAALQGFLGAVFGSLLVPFINHYLEKQKHKVKLQYEVVALVHSIYQLFKVEVNIQNNQILAGHFANIFHSIWLNSSDSVVKTKMVENIRLRNDQIKEYEPRSIENFNGLIKLEAELVRANLDILGTYGKTTFLKIDPIIKRILKNASDNKFFLVHDYSKMDLEQLEEAGNSFMSSLQKRIDDINTECEKIKAELTEVLSKINESKNRWIRFQESTFGNLLTFYWARRR